MGSLDVASSAQKAFRFIANVLNLVQDWVNDLGFGKTLGRNTRNKRLGITSD